LIFYFDASIQQPVAHALTMVRGDVLWAGGPGAPARDTPDEEWLPLAGANGWIVIGRDKRIRYRPREKQAVIDHKVAMFALTAAGNFTKWKVLDLLVRRWPQIEGTARTTEAPYIYAVTLNGVQRVPL
jgi:PIN like domain